MAKAERGRKKEQRRQAEAKARQRRQYALAALLVLLVAGAAAMLLRDRPASVDEASVDLPLPSPTAAAERRPEGYTEDLAAMCQELTEGDHPELGREPMREMLAREEALLAELDPAAAEQSLELAQLRYALAEEMVSQGDFEPAFERYEAARPVLTQATGLPEVMQERADAYHRWEALAYLRAAETANCIDSDNPFVCLLNRGAEGVYTDQTHSLMAIQHLEIHLDGHPDDTIARWLLNLAYMTIGRHPDGVPADWLIPPETFLSEKPAPRFVDVARQLGMAHNSMLGGSIIEDFDGDGLLDVLATTYDPCMHAVFYRNEGDGRFSDRSADAGLTDQLGGFNAQQTDYDNDGDMDVFITRGAWQAERGRQRNSLLRNEGDGRFVDVTHAAGLAEPAYPSQASAWADYDGDGYLDVYIGNEVDAEGQPYPSQLFHNNGDGTFTDVAVQSGVANRRMTKGVAWGDFDNDGDPDLYVSTVTANRLYENLGDGNFVDIAPRLGMQEDERTFATWFWDYDNDGWLDIYAAGYRAEVDQVAADHIGLPAGGSRPRLYRNDGAGGFEDVTQAAGLGDVRLPMGANFGDIDADGWPDIYLGTGEPSLAALFPNLMYWNEGGERFWDVTEAAGVGHLPKGHGVAFGDLDNDGDEDIYLQAGGFVPGDANPNALYRNPGGGNRWIHLRLQGRSGNRAAIGARVRVTVIEAGRPRDIHATVGSGGSFGASSLQLEIGLGRAERIESVEVRWPGNPEPQLLGELALDRIYRLGEGEVAQPLDLPRFELGS